MFLQKASHDNHGWTLVDKENKQSRLKTAFISLFETLLVQLAHSLCNINYFLFISSQEPKIHLFTWPF